MPLTDQQLRQELLNYGETVPPITQRNREQLRARLEQIRLRPRSPAKSSPSRSRGNTSTARSRPVHGLIELSDSETDTSANEYLSSRRSGRETNIQTRSVGVGRDTDRTNSLSSSNVTVDVEQSIARHRREIQQLIDSARDRARAANANISSNKYEPLPLPTKSAPSVRPNFAVPSRVPSSFKTDIKKSPKQLSRLARTRQTVTLFWTNNKYVITSVFKAIFIGLLIAGGVIFLKNNLNRIIPKPKKIACNIQNAIDCDDMIPVVNSIKRYLKIRTGEVDCGFRQKNELYVTKPEINKVLDAKGFKFESSSDDRWKTLITYILEKPVDDIL
ncbi:unnamed protein product [Rotaria socialis]|nr:unnamed protein product [Rotaria socialis]